MKKSESLIKKATNLNINGYAEGKKNLKNGSMEKTAIKRAKICGDCPSNVLEPIESLRVEDVLKETTNKCCDECGCSLPLLIRQNKKSCKLNKWTI